MRGIGPLNPAFGSSGKFDQRGITLIFQVKTCNWPDFLNLSVVAAKRFETLRHCVSDRRHSAAAPNGGSLNV